MNATGNNIRKHLIVSWKASGVGIIHQGHPPIQFPHQIFWRLNKKASVPVLTETSEKSLSNPFSSDGLNDKLLWQDSFPNNNMYAFYKIKLNGTKERKKIWNILTLIIGPEPKYYRNWTEESYNILIYYTFGNLN